MMSLRLLSPRRSGDHQGSKFSSQPSQECITSNAERPARDDHTVEMGPMPPEHENEIVVTQSLEQAEVWNKK